MSEKYVFKVLTDEANFSFEHGVANVGVVPSLLLNTLRNSRL